MNTNQDKKSKNSFEITSEGSLGLLALGDIGLRAWRKIRNHEDKMDLNGQEE